MMNKRSSRLIAWLLAMVMILNITPVTAFAGQSDSVKSEEKANPANVTIVYEAGNGGHFGNYISEKEKTGDQPSPAESEYILYDPNFRLAGWSTVRNYDG